MGLKGPNSTHRRDRRPEPRTGSGFCGLGQLLPRLSLEEQLSDPVGSAAVLLAAKLHLGGGQESSPRIIGFGGARGRVSTPATGILHGRMRCPTRSRGAHGLGCRDKGFIFWVPSRVANSIGPQGPGTKASSIETPTGATDSAEPR
jgi:hypothetical protein